MYSPLHLCHVFSSPSKSCILLSIPVINSSLHSSHAFPFRPSHAFFCPFMSCLSFQVMHSSLHPSHVLLYITSILPSYTLISYSHFIIVLSFTVMHSFLLLIHALFLSPVMHSSILLSHAFFCISQSCILLSIPVISFFPHFSVLNFSF
jgi:hypothetical protein